MTVDLRPNPEENLGTELSWDSGLAFAFGAEDEASPDREPCVVAGRSAQAGRYAIEEEIARGGMGTVHRARDLDLGRDVALKRMRPEWATDSLAVQRFFREARLAGQLQHPGVAPVYDFGVDGEGRPFLAMKLLRGQTMAGLMRDASEGLRSRAALLESFGAILETMAHAHALGVIHRDLKPENIMIGAFGDVSIMDWGFAKRIDLDGDSEDPSEGIEFAAEEGLSLAGSVMGTPRCMAPEQARGDLDLVDARADVFALGSMLLEILTGAGPYPAGTDREVLESAAAGRLREFDSDLQAAGTADELQALVREALRGDRDQRPMDAGELLREFEVWKLGAATREEQSRQDAAEARGRARVALRARRLTLTLSVIIIAALAGGAWAWQGRSAGRSALKGEVRGSLRELEVVAERDPEVALAALDQLALRVARDLDGDPLLLEVQARQGEWRARLEARDFMGELQASHVALARDDGDADLASLFARREIDVWEGSAEALRSATSRYGAAVTTEAALALDAWAQREEGERAQRLSSVARIIDTHPLRTSIRVARDASDRDRLRSIGAGLREGESELATILAYAGAWAGLNEADEAVDVLRLASQRDPDEFWLHFALAHALKANSRQMEEAERHFAAARAIRPRNPHAAVDHLRLMAQRGRTADAVEHIERLFGQSPEEPLVRDFLADLYAEVGRESDALRLRPRGRPGHGPGPGMGPGPGRGRGRGRSTWDARRFLELQRTDGPDAPLADRLEFVAGLKATGAAEEGLRILRAAMTGHANEAPVQAIELEFHLLLATGQRGKAREFLAGPASSSPQLERMKRHLDSLDEAAADLERFLMDGSLPGHPRARHRMFERAFQDKQFSIAARVFDALHEPGTAQPGLDRHRRDAVVAALIVSASKGDDATEKLPQGHELALTWAMEFLPGEGGGRGRPRMRPDEVLAWRIDPRLEPVRTEAGLAKLDEELAGRWRSFWARLPQPRRGSRSR